jgi:hypothetical protein
VEGCKDVEPLVPLPLPEDVILKVKGMGDEDELEESFKVLLRELCYVYKTKFLLHISEIGVISRDNPLLLREIQELEDMK